MTEPTIETMTEHPVPDQIPPRKYRFIGHYLYRSVTYNECFWHAIFRDTSDEVIRQVKADNTAIPGTLRLFEIPEDV